MFRRFSFMWTMRALLAAVALFVSLATAIAQDHAATLLSQVGQVSVLKDGNQVALFQGSAVRANQIVITGPNSYAKFQVADGSIFEVFENSKVTFCDRAAGWKDLLNVWIGHVKVYVQHLLGPNPTSVTSPTAVISVRGTVFDVDVEDEDGTTLVSVDEGAVEVRNLIMPGKTPILRPGDPPIRVYRNQPIARVIDHGGEVQKIWRAAAQVMRDWAAMHPAGVGSGPVGTVPGTGTGPQGDKGKNPGGAPAPTGGGSGAPAPPAAPTPPAPPGGGGGGGD